MILTSPEIERNLLERALTRMGPNGERWRPHTSTDDHQTGCLMNHLGSARGELYSGTRYPTLRGAEARLERAIARRRKSCGDSYMGIVDFNDSQSEFGPIREVVREALEEHPR